MVAFAGRGPAKEALNCYSLCDVLKENFGGWELATLQRPASVHLALTLPSARNAAAFIEDLKAAVAMLRADPEKWSGGTAGLYGSLSKLPPAFLEESAKVCASTYVDRLACAFPLTCSIALSLYAVGPTSRIE